VLPGAVVYFRPKLISVVLLSVLSAGCSVVAPERDSANQLMGKDIKEAYARFGKPFMIGKETSVKPDDKLYGQATYLFVRVGSSYTTQNVTGSSMDTSSGQPVHTTYYETNKVTDSCKVQFWTTQDNIIDYYDIKGNCGLFDWGFGNTGALHRYGIN
jgi:hypothetical protein